VSKPSFREGFAFPQFGSSNLDAARHNASEMIPPDEAISISLRDYYGVSDPSKCREAALECIKRFPEFEYGYTGYFGIAG
jgi:hypothetical protein